MEDEYETLCASSVENCKTIAEWVFDHEAEVMQHSMSGVGTGHWIFTIALVVGKEYRRKKPQPYVLLTDPEEIARGIADGVVEISRDKEYFTTPLSDSSIPEKLLDGWIFRLKPGCKLPPKLVPRTAEELMKLIGKCLIRMKTNPGIVHLLIDNDYDGDQEHWEMCYIGECVWRPMMKESGVEE